MQSWPKSHIWAAVAALVAADQLVKYLISTASTAITLPLGRLELTYNPAGPFSLPVTNLQAIALTLPILTALAYVLTQSSPPLIRGARGVKAHQRPRNTKHWLLPTGVSLLLAGGFSNLLDRLIHGAVIDVITVHTATLNLADVFIGIGLILVIASLATAKSPETKN